ncbi:hypothetical protein [Mucilaginibacter sp.]|uniref:hypothetical protein n=1 Tax=Mucilaginibacter sp. TaxID=1882438 RepID=UPI003AFFF510
MAKAYIFAVKLNAVFINVFLGNEMLQFHCRYDPMFGCSSFKIKENLLKKLILCAVYKPLASRSILFLSPQNQDEIL